MDAYFGSILNRFNKVTNMTVYVRTLPEGFIRPSMYFPRPDINEVTGGLQFEFAEHLLKITLFGNDIDEAFNNASKLKKDLINTRKFVEFVDFEGNLLNEFFKVSDIQIRTNDIDMTATMTLNYTVEEVYGREDYIPIEYVNISNEVVEDV